jgi:hypothetical protein
MGCAPNGRHGAPSVQQPAGSLSAQDDAAGAARNGIFQGIENRTAADSDERLRDKFLRGIAIFLLTWFLRIHKIWIDY